MNNNIEKLKLSIKHCVTQEHNNDCPFAHYDADESTFNCWLRHRLRPVEQFANYDSYAAFCGIPLKYETIRHSPMYCVERIVESPPPDWCPLQTKAIKIERG